MYNNRLMLIFGLLLLIVSPVSTPAQHEAGTRAIVIQGTLTDADSGEPIVGPRPFTVQFFDLETDEPIAERIEGVTEVSESGRFHIEVVPPEELGEILRPGYQLGIAREPGKRQLGEEDLFPEKVSIHSAPSSINSMNSQRLGGRNADDYIDTEALEDALDEAYVTLDEAYDARGNGFGRIIEADSGAVEIQSNGGLLVLDLVETRREFRVQDDTGEFLYARLYRNGDGGRLELEGGPESGSILADSEANQGPIFRMRSPEFTETLVMEGTHAGNEAMIRLNHDDGSPSISLESDNFGGIPQISMDTNSGAETVKISADDGNDFDGSYIRLSNIDSIPTVELDSNDDGVASLNLQRPGGGGGAYTETVQLMAGDSSNRGGALLLRDEQGRNRIEMTAFSAGMIFNDSNGNPVITIDANHQGDARVTTEELEITGGSDVSEMFDVAPTETGQPVQPGTVVSIDPENPGKLRISNAAYDRTVVGIVSGAGGVETGFMLRQEGSKADGDVPVALTGRVYVRTDATNGAIQPGDLLTTSPTPGHAMAVGDHDKATGAIIGKAMTSLDEGQDLVLAIVSLQ